MPAATAHTATIPTGVLFTDFTDGGKRATVVARYDAGRRSIRPITAWEEP